LMTEAGKIIVTGRVSAKHHALIAANHWVIRLTTMQAANFVTENVTIYIEPKRAQLPQLAIHVEKHFRIIPTRNAIDVFAAGLVLVPTRIIEIVLEEFTEERQFQNGIGRLLAKHAVSATPRQITHQGAMDTMIAPKPVTSFTAHPMNKSLINFWTMTPQ